MLQLPTCDGHLVLQLDDDPATKELAGEVEQVAVVEHDEELGELPLGVGEARHAAVRLDHPSGRPALPPGP